MANFEEINFSKDKEENFTKNISFEFSSYKDFDVKIDEGRFGNVFYGINHENSFPIALKIFKKNNLAFYYFKREIDYINTFKVQIFFPKIYHYIFSDNNKVFSQTLHGYNLKKLADICGGKSPIYAI